MLEGDDALIYHTGSEKAAVGLARIASAPYPDPSDPKLVVVDIEVGRPLARPVTLAQIKAEPSFAELGLVRVPRLSVVPVEPGQWKRLLAMAGTG
jgi:predicted RNA-binding protein with PUA-like domain